MEDGVVVCSDKQFVNLDGRGETEGLEALEAAVVVVSQAAGVLEISRLDGRGCHVVSTIGDDWTCGDVVELEALVFPRHWCRSFRHAAVNSAFQVLEIR
jgi:hypothetical protein